MLWRKKNIIIVLLLIFLIVAVGSLVIYKNMNQKNNDSLPLKTSTTQAVDSLDIKNLYLYTDDININTQEKIESAVYSTVKESLPGVKKLEGTVRNDSFISSKMGTGSLITFLVDIKSVQRSYKISLGTDEDTGENSLYVLCPTEPELIYPAFSCKGDTE